MDLKQGAKGPSLADVMARKGLDAHVLAKGATGVRVLEIKETGGTRVENRPTTDVVITPKPVEKNSPTKPVKTSPDEVIFSSNGRNLGSPLPKGDKWVRFKSGWLLTKDKEIIEFVRANAKAWGVAEVKEEAKKA